MRIALLFNPRPTRPLLSARQPDDAYEEYDGPDTIAAIMDALAVLGEVVPVEADRTLAQRLDAGRFDIAFNIAEGSGRRCREAHAAAVCELLQLPFSHSDALTLAVTLDKTLAKRVVSPDVAVAPAILLADHETVSAMAIEYPVIVKPNDEGSSKGIRGDAVAYGPSDADRLVRRLRERYGCPVLVERFLPGAEVTVGVVGNGRQARLLGMMEVAPAEPSASFVYSVEAKRAFRQQVRYFIPPRIDAGTRCRIEADALTAYRLLGCRDVARLDFRLDASGRPYFLECNPLPGLDPAASDLVILSRASMPYGDLIRGIIGHAMERHALGDTQKVP